MSIWNKDPKMIELFVKHYNLELRASNLYFNCATIAKKLGYDNLSIFFVNLASDKQKSHMIRILDFFIKLDIEMPTLTISVPDRIQNQNVQEIVNQAMSMELTIRKHINEMCQYALEINDYESFQRLQWFVKDAIEDLSDVDDISTYVNSPNATLLSIETAVRRKNKNESVELYEVDETD